MNTRINKTLSALAVLGIVASSFVWALPVSAATPGDARWTAQDVPSDTDNVLVSGSGIMDIAVGTDGKTIYVANALSTDYIFKSTDGGKTFDSVMNDYGGATPIAIAVAPDDVNTAAVADASTVWITRDGGTTWSDLSAPTLGNGTITDIAVAPSRSGTLLGREYFISVADTTAGVTGGDVKTIGVNTAWESVATTGIAGVADFTSIALSPNYVGDRGLVAIGTSATAPGATKVYIVNVSSKAIVGTPTALDTASTIVDVGAAANDIISSSIALPSNFDPASGSNSRVYVGINSNVTAENDVYRYTDEAVRRLGADAKINSVAFAGTVSSGKLFAGLANSPEVKYSANPTATDPDWDTNDTSLTGDATNPRVVLAVASDFATSNKVFAGTQGSQSAFFVTEDAGISFYAQSLVNVGAVILPSPSLSFTGSTVFLTSNTTGGYFNIWKSDVPFTSTSWKRIYAQTGTANAGFQLKVNPAYATTPALYIVETGVADSKIYVSQDAGVTWSTRFAPSGVTHGASVLRDAQTIYFVTNTGDIYKSTNAAWTWGDVVDTGLTGASSITLPAANQVIVGGNSVAISTDDAETFTLMDNGLDAGTSYSVTRDADYANNHLIYAADTAVANDVFRVDASNTDNSWDNMNAPINAQVKGITQRNGVLFVTVAADADNVIRTLFPAATIGDQYWNSLTAGTAFTPGAGVSATGSILLYVRGTDSKIYAYNDFLAGTKPTLTTPADNFNLAVDPASGYGYATDLKFQPMTSGSTKVDAVNIEIADKTNGLTGNPTATINVNTNNPFVNTSSITGFNLQPNHSYVWRIRAASTTTEDSIISPWSDTRTINVQAGGQVVQQQAGVILQGPQPGASNVNPNLVGFSWAPVPGATEYQIIIAENAALTTTVAGTPAKVTTTSYQATGLKAGTTYFWAVQATAPTTSQQSVGTFVTAAPAATTGPAPTGTTGGQPTIIVNQPPAETPAYIWAVIAIGAILIIAVIILIVRTRRVP